MARPLGLEERLLCRIARVPRDEDAADPAELSDPGLDWDRLWRLALRHEVQPLAWAWLRSRPDRRARVPAEIATRAERTSFGTAIRNGARAATLAEILEVLNDEGIGAMPVKGVALNELLYGAEAPRTFDDLDILVRRDEVADARRTLWARGWRRRRQPTFEEATHRYHDLQLFREVNGEWVCVELHWDLWPSARFDSIVDKLWDRSRPITIGRFATRTLSAEDTLLHLAIHRTSSALRLRFVCDIAELVRVEGDRLDWTALEERANRVGARLALHMALRLASELLDAPVPRELLARTKPSRVRGRILDRTCGVAALFRPAADDDHRQQPRLAYRILEQDRPFRIVRALAFGAVRKVRRAAYMTRMRATG